MGSAPAHPRRARAASLAAPGRIELVELEIDDASGLGWLEVEASGVCVADGQSFRGVGGPPHRMPVVLGHEIIGRVVTASSITPDWLAPWSGRRVVVNDARACGTCSWCRRGLPRDCKEPHYGHIPLAQAPGTWGGYAELVCLDERSDLHPLPDSVPIESATFAFALASGMEWTRLAGAGPGDRVSVVGKSRMAIATALAAHAAGCEQVRIVGIEPNDLVDQACGQLGIECIAIDPGLGPVEHDVDEVVVTVTESTAAEFALAIDIVARRGRVIAACTATDAASIVPEEIRRKGLTVIGGRGHSAASLDAAIDLIVRDPQPFAALCTGTYTIDEVDRALGDLVGSTGALHGLHHCVIGTRTA